MVVLRYHLLRAGGFLMSVGPMAFQPSPEGGGVSNDNPRPSDSLQSRRHSHSYSLLSHLVALTLGCTLPLVILGCILAAYLVSHEYARAKLEVEDRLVLMNNAIEARVANVIEDLQVLATA